MAKAETFGAERGLDRFEGFTDAVFAIAITLLIVELKAPGTPQGPPEPHGLARALMDEWRGYLGLVVSFVLIGIYWLQHHYSGRIYRKSDHVFGLANLVFLFGIMFAPYPLRTWAEHIGQGEDERIASAFAAFGLFLPALGWLLKWFYGVPGKRLIDERLDPSFLRTLGRQYTVTTLVLALSVPLALVWPRLGLGIAFLVTLAYALPPRKPRYVDAN